MRVAALVRVVALVRVAASHVALVKVEHEPTDREVMPSPTLSVGGLHDIPLGFPTCGRAHPEQRQIPG